MNGTVGKFRQHSYLLLSFLGYSMLPFPALSAVTLAEITQLSFGIVEIPSSGSNNITIDYDNGTAMGTGILVHDSTARGQYLLSSTEASELVTLDIQNVSTDSSALNLTNFKGRYNGQVITNFPVSNLSIPRTGALLSLGATLVFTNSVTEKPYSLNYDIVINYE